MVRPLNRFASVATANTATSSWFFLLWWILAGLVSYTVGFPVGQALGKSLLWGWVVGGGLAALLQWVLLRHQLTRAGWWIVASVAGLIVGTGLSFVVSQYVLQVGGLTASFASVGATVGFGIGVAQCAVLRLQVRRSGWWVLASTAGYSLGVLAAVNNPVDILLRSGLIFGPAFGGVIGVVSGAVTGAAMLWLLRRPVARRAGISASAS
jgi:hypothetical protein